MDADRVDFEALGETIKWRRSRRNLNTHQLSERAGVGDSYLREIEAGKASPGLDVLVRIAGILNVTVEDLLRDAGIVAAKRLEGELGGIYQRLDFTERRAFLRIGHVLLDAQQEYAALLRQPPKPQPPAAQEPIPEPWDNEPQAAGDEEIFDPDLET